MNAQTARVRVTRKSEWASRLRTYRVRLDGEDVGGVASGRSADFRVPPGEHELQLWLDGCCSRPHTFRLAKGETKEFQCGCHFGPRGVRMGMRKTPDHLLYLMPADDSG